MSATTRRPADPTTPSKLRVSLAVLVLAGSTAPIGAQAPWFDLFGEATGCAAPSLCGDFGNNLAVVGDVNGDGVTDLAVSGPTVSADEPSVGRVYVFFGPFDGGDIQAGDADVTVTGLAFGDLVATPHGGDLNGDGVGDLVLGARGPDIGGTLNGQVWVFYGPLSGDLLVSDADATITGTSFSELGRAIDVGDFDDDGIDDVLAGASQSGSGSAHVFLGPLAGDLGPGDADATVTGTMGLEELGSAVAAVDLDGDGVDDIVVGAPNFPLVDVGAGSVFVFFSPVEGTVSSTQADVTILGEALRDSFGSFLDTAGDVDGNGSEDLVVGAWQVFLSDGPGKAYVFSGPLAPGTYGAGEADAILTGEAASAPSDHFGIVAGAGDFDGDGFDDVLVGAQFGGASSRGRCYLFRGPLAGAIPAAAADSIFDAPGFDPDNGLDVLGRGVGAGDLDGDGFPELLLGGPGSDGPGFARVIAFDGVIFADGFESGDISRWSTAVP